MTNSFIEGLLKVPDHISGFRSTNHPSSPFFFLLVSRLDSRNLLGRERTAKAGNCGIKLPLLPTNRDDSPRHALPRFIPRGLEGNAMVVTILLDFLVSNSNFTVSSNEFQSDAVIQIFSFFLFFTFYPILSI